MADDQPLTGDTLEEIAWALKPAADTGDDCVVNARAVYDAIRAAQTEINELKMNLDVETAKKADMRGRIKALRAKACSHIPWEHKMVDGVIGGTWRYRCYWCNELMHDTLWEP